MPRKPTDTLTWKKDDKYIKIDKFYHQTILINKDTGKTEISITEVSEIPPITRKRKHKHK
jgi:hypothetical protein